MKVLEVRVTEQDKSHVCVTLFMGEENQTLANTGKLCMTLTEYQLFGATLSSGGSHHSRGEWRIGVPLLVVHEGFKEEEEIVKT